MTLSDNIIAGLATDEEVAEALGEIILSAARKNEPGWSLVASKIAVVAKPGMGVHEVASALCAALVAAVMEPKP